MKFLDRVKVLCDNKKYNENGIYRNMEGTIIDAEIRNNCFNVVFIDERVKDKKFMADESNFLSLKDDILYPIQLQDLELVEDNHCSDETILNSLPQNNALWWCKVENGYITNLKGERKNKTPFDYNS